MNDPVKKAIDQLTETHSQVLEEFCKARIAGFLGNGMGIDEVLNRLTLVQENDTRNPLKLTHKYSYTLRDAYKPSMWLTIEEKAPKGEKLWWEPDHGFLVGKMVIEKHEGQLYPFISNQYSDFPISLSKALWTDLPDISKA